MKAAQEEAAERQPTKKEMPYHFQKKGHEEQFAFNDGVADKLEEAEGYLARVARNLADVPAKDALEKAREATKCRLVVFDRFCTFIGIGTFYMGTAERRNVFNDYNNNLLLGIRLHM